MNPSRILTLVIFTSVMGASRGEMLYVATPFTAEGSFTEGVEGPASDAEGNVYAVNFGRQQTIGKFTLDGHGSVFLELPGKSVGNGIRFNRAGTMFIADYTGHNVLKFESGKLSVLAHGDEMNQPNDLAITAEGMLFASDPNWKNGTGQVWRIDANGKITRVAEQLGTSNGIETSPNDRILYVNESVQRNIWAFDLGADGSLQDKRLFKKFDDFGFDGMRCDAEGNLYVCRHGKGTVVKLSPSGKVLREINVLGPMPTNICFGGRDGRTAFVTEVKHRRLVQFRVETPGLEWKRFHPNESR